MRRSRFSTNFACSVIGVMVLLTTSLGTVGALVAAAGAGLSFAMLAILLNPNLRRVLQDVTGRAVTLLRPEPRCILSR